MLTRRQFFHVIFLLDYPESPLWKKSRPQPLRYKETDREGDSLKEICIAEASSAGVASTETPFDFDAYLESMRTHQQRHIQIIGRFFHAKGLIFDNLTQVQVAIKRHLRAARDLAGFSNQQIDNAITKVERQYSDIEWTLETILKVLTK